MMSYVAIITKQAKRLMNAFGDNQSGNSSKTKIKTTI
jgi:hypothetical protein